MKFHPPLRHFGTHTNRINNGAYMTNLSTKEAIWQQTYNWCATHEKYDTSYKNCGLRRPRSACTNAQADLGLRSPLTDRRCSNYSRLSLSRIPRDTLKYFEISVLRHIRFAELRKKLIRLTTFNKYMCNWALEVRDILKILWKRARNCSLEAISPLFHNIFYMLLDFHV